jgi:hypothetical protein
MYSVLNNIFINLKVMICYKHQRLLIMNKFISFFFKDFQGFFNAYNWNYFKSLYFILNLQN